MRTAMSRPLGLRGLALVVAAALALTACADEGTPAPPGLATTLTGTINVFAAASLTDVFEAIASDFVAANPGADVIFSFAASSALATQINEGAPADVFASADLTTMKTVTEAGNNAGEPSEFALNQLVIAVEEGNPKDIAGLADLARDDVMVALCAQEAPCGRASQNAIATTSLTITPRTYTENVRAALNLVMLGEVDAALVYRTDAAIEADEVDAVEFPESSAAVNHYPIVALKDALNEAGAAAFVAFVLSPAGATKLTDHGFGQP
jgi:molybdate transport system substrate-binding protein